MNKDITSPENLYIYLVELARNSGATDKMMLCAAAEYIKETSKIDDLSALSQKKMLNSF